MAKPPKYTIGEGGRGMYVRWLLVRIIKGKDGRVARDGLVTIAIPPTDPSVNYLCRLSRYLLGVHEGRYSYMQDLQRLAHSPLPIPALLPCWSHCPTPVRLSALSFYL